MRYANETRLIMCDKLGLWQYIILFLIKYIHYVTTFCMLSLYKNDSLFFCHLILFYCQYIEVPIFFYRFTKLMMNIVTFFLLS